MSENLVAYFSRTGEQYGVGEISKGNTESVAELLAAKIGADLFKITVVNDDYPNKYDLLIERAKQEKLAKIRPELDNKVTNFEQYKNIFIGYPNWWGDMPMAVYSFIESYDFSNKNVFHFCTHEGSGGVHADDFEIYGHVAQKDNDTLNESLDNWLKKINI